MEKKNICLIGMPGSGKSTIGRMLAEKLNMKHTDGDGIMEEYEGMKLQDVINTKGNEYVRGLEEKVLSGLDVEGYVISPGGSCVFYPKAMANLLDIATVIYLQVDWPALEKRCTNVHGRGILFEPGETLKDIYDKRIPLYEKYAEITLNTSDFSKYETLEHVLKIVNKE